MKWYNELIKAEIDGLEPLLKLFTSENDFYRHFFSNVYFFEQSTVLQQAKHLKERIEKGEKIPVRYSMKSKEYFYYKNENTNNGISKKSFKNKKEAAFSFLKDDFYHKNTDIKVCIDKDGNYYVREEIYKAVKYKVSIGAKSHIKNYEISHIWGETENPLYFTSLWNILLVPNYLSFILDKSDQNSEIVRKIKIIAKALSFILYNPNEIALPTIIDEKELTVSILVAKKYLEEDIVKYIGLRGSI